MVQDPHGGEVDRHRDEPAVDLCQHSVLIRSPVGEPREEATHARCGGVEDVRAVAVAQDPMLVGRVVGVPGKVPAPVDDEHA